VRQAIAEVIGNDRGEDLRLGFQTAKGTGMDDAVAIALKWIAIRMFGLGITPSPAFGKRETQVSQHYATSGSRSGFAPQFRRSRRFP